MKLLPEKNAVLIAPKNPKRLAKLIPTAKLVTVDGRLVVAVPHRLDETRVLNNLGVKVPSPMLGKYSWPRSLRIKNPFDAQRLTAGFLTLNRRGFVLNDLGTGKSLAALWAYDWLRAKGVVNKLLIVCPLSTMERTWADEIFLNLPHLEYQVLHGTKTKRLKNLNAEADVYIINHHGVKVITEELAARKDIDVVVVDEVALCRNKHDIWKSLNKIINHKTIARYAWGLTGTPIPNDPTDAYWQVKLINPRKAPMYFTRFKHTVMQQLNQWVWVAKPDALDRVDELMQPAIRFRRDQCIDLPPTIYMTREVPLTDDAEKAYKAMKNNLQAQLEAGEITAVNEAVKASKLVQIACGVAYSPEGEEMCVDATPRMNEVVSLIQQSDSKTIVFVPFVSAVAQVADHIRAAGYTVGVIHGGVKKNDRDEVFGGFQNSDNNPQVIVAQPAAMSHGLTLTAASTIVWYAPVTSGETYEQANGRITRPGQKYTTVIVNVEGTPVERRMYARLKTKQKMQNILLEKKVFHEAA